MVFDGVRWQVRSEARNRSSRQPAVQAGPEFEAGCAIALFRLGEQAAVLAFDPAAEWLITFRESRQLAGTIAPSGLNSIKAFE